MQQCFNAAMLQCCIAGLAAAVQLQNSFLDRETVKHNAGLLINDLWVKRVGRAKGFIYVMDGTALVANPIWN